MRPATRVNRTEIPDLAARIDALLRLPAETMPMPRDLLALYKNAVRPVARRTTFHWNMLAAGLNFVSIGFDFDMVPPHLLVLDIVFRLIITAGFILSAMLFNRDISIGREHFVLLIPCLVTLVLAGITGAFSGDAILLERFLTYAIIVILSAIMSFRLDIRYMNWLAGIALVILSAFIITSGIQPEVAKYQIILVYGGAMGALLWGRHALNRYQFRMFLLNLREELRNTEAAARNLQLSSLAYTDKLTDIPNRRYFDEICQSMSDTTKNLLPLSLCIIDIDHFKRLNDSLGHLQGDRCLLLVATAIRNTLRGKTDILARYGGEEFVVLLPATTLDDAMEVVERIRAAIVNLNHPNPGSPYQIVTASFGVAAVNVRPLHIEALIRAADEALYNAKSAGRNRVLCNAA